MLSEKNEEAKEEKEPAQEEKESSDKEEGSDDGGDKKSPSGKKSDDKNKKENEATEESGGSAPNNDTSLSDEGKKELEPITSGAEKISFGIISDVPLQISVVLGRTMMSLGKLRKVGPGAVIKLDNRVEDLVDISVNGRIIAKGELCTTENGTIGIRVKQVSS